MTSNRPKRSAHGAVKQVQQHIQAGYRHCVDMDLAKFFDTVQHDVLLARVARKVRDKRLLGLIGRFLRAGILVDGLAQPTEEGTMQGGPLSPLLSNILLDDLDKELEKRGLRFVRLRRRLPCIYQIRGGRQACLRVVGQLLNSQAQAGGQSPEEPNVQYRRS